MDVQTKYYEETGKQLLGMQGGKCADSIKDSKV